MIKMIKGITLWDIIDLVLVAGCLTIVYVSSRLIF
jgi:hypothetical protein